MSRTVALPVLRAAVGSEGNARREPDAPKEKCGVVGVWGHPHAVDLAYLGLYAQQHRGQESAGIAVSDGASLHTHLGMGLVADVFGRSALARLRSLHAEGTGVIGHNRYSTAGGSLDCNTQPLVERTIDGEVGLAHNGNLINADALRTLFGERGHLFHTTSDTEVIIHLLASPEQRSSADPLAATLRRLMGAFSLVLLFPDRIEACRDPWGWRPLVLGELERDGRVYPCVASETVALDVMGARLVREVEPGEIVTLNAEGVTSRRYAAPAERLAQCVFEHVYFASPASNVFGQNVQTAREKMGEVLAREAPADADWVMPMPDSGRSAANGYARASGIPYREAIVPNRYVGRTFIKPTQGERDAAVRLKLNVVREIVEGRRLIVVDDSIVRGTTTRVKMQQLRAAGAKEIHLRISSPPIRHPCYFGVDFATKEQLIAGDKTVEEIRQFLGIDSLHFLSLDGLLSVMDRPANDFCTACFSGEYRLDIDHPTTEQVLFKEQTSMF
ncbi:MAG: amidophosphoribosyltransferase [Phycisphaerales bacterium]